MRRGFFIIIGIVLMLAAVTSALAINFDANYGTTRVSMPSTLLTVRVDNAGNVTGTGSQVKVSHSEPGTWCHKVRKVEAHLYAASCPGLGSWCWYGQGDKNFKLCNFNERDATFDFFFPAVFPAQVNLVKQAWIRECRASGKNGARLITQHPFFIRDPSLTKSYLYVRLYFANDDQKTLKYQVPPVILTCDPCPQLVVKDSIQLQPDAMVTLSTSSVVARGGISPYTVSFSKLPIGLIQQGGSLTGRPAQGSYIGTVTVRDSCRSATNEVTRKFQFDVKDLTPPTLTGLSITPSVLTATGGDVVFKVTASDNKAVTDVTAAVSRPGWGMRVFVNRISGNEKSGVWQGTYKAPPNTTNQDATYTVDFIAGDSDGNKSKFVKGAFVVKGKPGGSTTPAKPKGMYVK